MLFLKEIIHITGHKNPDTDSIVASIAYAELKRQLGISAIACRIGDINSETDFVLKKFQAPEPVYIENAKVKLYDVPYDEPLIAHKDCTIKEAWDRINATRTVTLYVVDKEEHLIGVVTMSDISKVLMSEKENPKSLMKNAPVDNLCKVLDGKFLYKAPFYRTNGMVHMLASNKAVYSDMNFKDCIVVVTDDLQLQRRVICDGAACVILVDVDIISQGIKKLAEENNCTLIQTPMDLFRVARRIYRAPSIEQIMKRKLISFHNHDYIQDAYNKMSKSRFRSYPILNNQGKVLGSISRYHLLNYRKKKFILVDHNETSQSVDNLEDAEVIEIIDHHRIGDVETTTPIRFRNEILGSTCTIIALMYKEHHIVPTKQIASLLCCAIISDTMNFNSPTTTETDKIVANELAKIAELDLNEIAKEMYGAVATLKGRSMSEILYNDFKEYNIDGKRIAIGQINVAEEKEILEIREEFLEYMKTINEINKFDLMMMCFTSVEGKGSNLLFIGELSWIVDETFKDDILDDYYFVDSVISRKKQIIPRLSMTLNHM